MCKNIVRPTWIVRADCNSGKKVFSTEGLDIYGSLELELNLSINPQQATYFLNLIGMEIANGKIFKDGDFNDSIFTCEVAFKEVIGIYGNGKKKLRVIFKDPNFKYPWEQGCQEPYRSQISLRQIESYLC